ncbi:PTS lactose/cellobiose transporter subunit IIA [Paramaledivibacter caminithermalis]|jgi:PTS system cellobiose-specific IIA component|uniref:PTS system, cellobiose-specific IIA component n=1 Tax=Paramaledivibacter caminithermalis (strain DSM 15212 / CIP 107654 / DViRD3) TaxID=1121301 RepID=A0A1M6PGT3_PARC5|nr:PTS lactose/cellobiose transporter subunit IIA [Paramaledivibacter caminithermalis]SHK07168.1 PTS system, cellobiose-specific IIA component [Paramaledivibacter caminithermalis DSM 15212]
MDFEMNIFTIITYSGDARSSSMEAITYAKQGDFEKAKECIEEAIEKLELAHKEQTKLIQAEAQGEKHNISLLLIHAQDHLMNAMTVKDLANEFIDIYKTIK